MSNPTKVGRRGFVASMVATALGAIFLRRRRKARPAKNPKLPTWIGHY